MDHSTPTQQGQNRSISDLFDISVDFSRTFQIKKYQILALIPDSFVVMALFVSKGW